MRRRGSILVQVLMTSVVVAVIAAGLMNMLMRRAALINRAREGVMARRKADSSFGVIMSRWNEAGMTCANSVPGFSLSGTPGSCACTYDDSATPQNPDISARLVAGRCTLTIVADP